MTATVSSPEAPATSGETMPLRPLGEVLTRSTDWITLDPTEVYTEVTVRLWGKGVIARGEKLGGEIGGTRRLRVHPREFILSRIDARNGAFGLVPAELDGAVVSNDFPCFRADESALLPEYLGWLSWTRWFSESCKQVSEGTTNRVRLNEEKFLAIRVPLPPVGKQRRLVAKIERLADKVDQAREMRREACERIRVLLASALSDAFPKPTDSTVATYAKVQSGYAFKSAWFTDDGIRLARNANVSHGALDWGDTARIPESMRGEYERFELSEGDILISLDRPLISTGLKVARVTQADLPCLLLQRVGRFQFHSDDVLPEYLYHWLHSPHFVHSIDPGRSNGVPHISQKDIERIPFVAPSIVEQRDTIAKLDAVYKQVRSIERLQHKTAAELDALLPSILDKAFKGEL